MTFERRRDPQCDRLIDESGVVVFSFDLSELDLSPTIADTLLRAFAGVYGHTALNTQKRIYHAIRNFVLFLQERRIAHAVPLPAMVLLDFRNWLARRTIKPSSAQTILGQIKAFLLWTQRNVPEVVAKDIRFDCISFVRTERNEVFVPTPDTARSVLRICYEKIEKIEARLSFGASLLDGTYEKNSENERLASTIRDLLVAGGGEIPLQREMRGIKGSRIHRRVAECGGLRRLKSLVSLVLTDILPFYLVVLIQTAGNPEAIRLLKTDCITTHPLRDDIEFLSWYKPRSARMQRVDFPARKEWAAPNIVRRLMALNSNIRSNSVEKYQEYVFVSSAFSKRAATLISIQSLHNYLAEFIQENNLPDFDFVDWRPTVAKEFKRVTGTIKTAQRRLNHQHPSTTGLYVADNKFEISHYRAIAKFQGSLVTELDDPPVKVRNETDVHVNRGRAYETVFGFGCWDPYSGLDGLTPVGELCLSFTRCCTCPGALILVDSPSVVARILATKEALEGARRQSLVQGWNDRFENVYGNTLYVIDNFIIPLISERVKEKAMNISKQCPIPHLE